jgi:hypothetical protein
MTKEDKSPSLISQSPNRPHPKVNLPFFRNSRSKKTTTNLIKYDESLNEDSTQETESNKNKPSSRQYIKWDFNPNFIDKIENVGLKWAVLDQRKVDSINNLDYFSKKMRMKEMTKRNLLANFSNMNISYDNSFKNNQERENHQINNIEQMKGTKVNIQRFLINKNAAWDQPPVTAKDFMESGKNFTFYNSNNKNPSHSVPKQRTFSRFSGLVPIINNYEQARSKNKLKILTNYHESNIKEDFDYFKIDRNKNNYSVIHSPSNGIEDTSGSHNFSQQVSNRTIDSQTPTNKSECFKLPTLTTRNKKRRNMISNSSARKKIPTCFLMNEARSTKSRASDKIDHEHYVSIKLL